MYNTTLKIPESNPVPLDIFTLSFYSATFLVGVVGNLLVLRVLFLQRKKDLHGSMSITNIYLASLALADLLTAITIPLQFLFCSHYLLEYFIISPYVCVALKAAQVFVYNVSILTMVLIAIDRYRLIHNPLQSKHKRLSPKYTLPIIYVLSMLNALTCVFSMKIFDYFRSANTLIGCRILFPHVLPIPDVILRRIRVGLLFIGFYIIPLLITIPLYVLSIRTIYKRPRIGQSSQIQSTESKYRSIKILIIMLLIFVLSWVPFHVLNIYDLYFPDEYHTFSKSENHLCDASTFYMALYWIAISSCCYNPFIYSWFNKTFRKYLTKCCRRHK